MTTDATIVLWQHSVYSKDLRTTRFTQPWIKPTYNYPKISVTTMLTQFGSKFLNYRLLTQIQTCYN